MVNSGYTWCLTTTEIVRLPRDGEKERGGGMEVGEEGDKVFVIIKRLAPGGGHGL